MRSWTTRYIRNYQYARVRQNVPEDLKYAVQEEKFDISFLIKGKFIQLTCDEETEEFLETCYDDSYWNYFLLCCARPCLKPFLGHSQTNGLLGTGQMFLLSTEHLRTLLQYPNQSRTKSNPSTNNLHNVSFDGLPMRQEQFSEDGEPVIPLYGRALDVGAGAGRVTDQLAPLVREVYTTEVSSRMGDALRSKGYQCYLVEDLRDLPPEATRYPGIDKDGNIIEYEGFDLICLFNLIDRCMEPITLLKTCKKLLRNSSSRIIIATPFPFCPSVEVGTKWVRPRERIHVCVNRKTCPAISSCHHNISFETSCIVFAEIMAEMGFKVESVSRIPYISQGDMSTPYYVLDDAVFVLSCADNE